MNNEGVRIHVGKAIETAYWFGVVDGIRDTYKMVFKQTEEGSDRLNTALSETLERVMDMGNLDNKNMHVVVDQLYRQNDLGKLKQMLWASVLMNLPDFRDEIVFNKHMGKIEGNLRKQLDELDRKRKEQ